MPEALALISGTFATLALAVQVGLSAFVVSLAVRARAPSRRPVAVTSGMAAAYRPARLPVYFLARNAGSTNAD